jgi:O-antigen ligase
MDARLDPTGARILTASAALLTLACATGLAAPPLFWITIAGMLAAGLVFLAFRFTPWFCAAWLLLTGMTLEMTLYDLIGPDAYQPTIAAIKATQIALACVCAIRYGFRPDILCPAWAFLAMFALGTVHASMPGIATPDTLRSAIGSIAPFAFCFCRPPRDWANAIVKAAKWAPAVAVACGIPLAIAGIRPLFTDSGGWRLGGLGHPAFLAGVCLPAIYACLIELFRTGRKADLRLLAANLAILVLTGARAPFAYAAAVTSIAFLTIRSTIFPRRIRLIFLMTGIALLFAAAAIAGEVRLFNVGLNETTNLSGRDLLWPSFQDAAARSPWFGSGIGAANAVIPPDGRVARLLHTWSAHNEYLRILVEGGLTGLAMLFALFAAWVCVHSHGLRPSSRRIVRLAFMALAMHAVTDNVLISTPASVLFTFAAAVFTRDRAD